MTDLKTTTILAIAGIALFATPVMAEDAEMTQEAVDKTANTAVLAAIETADLIPVTDENGNVFYNHYVADSELYDATIDLETVDTYTFEYEGRTYTNKIVTEDD